MGANAVKAMNIFYLYVLALLFLFPVCVCSPIRRNNGFPPDAVDGSLVVMVKVGEPQVTLRNQQLSPGSQGVAIGGDMMQARKVYFGDVLIDQWDKEGGGLSLEQKSRRANMLVLHRNLDNVLDTKVPVVRGLDNQFYAVGFAGSRDVRDHFKQADTSNVHSPPSLAQVVDDSYRKAWEPRLQRTGMNLQPQEFLMTDGKDIYVSLVGINDYGKQRQGPLVHKYDDNLQVRGWNPEHFQNLLDKAGYGQQQPAVKEINDVESDFTNAFGEHSRHLFTPNSVSASWNGHILDASRKKAYPIGNIDMNELNHLQSTPERSAADLIYDLKKSNLWDIQLEDPRGRFDQHLRPFIREANDRLQAEEGQRTARNPEPPQVPSRARRRSRRRNSSSRSPSSRRSPSREEGMSSSGTRRRSPSVMGRTRSRRIPPPVPPKPSRHGRMR